MRNHTLLESFTLDVRHPISDDILQFLADVVQAMPTSVRTVRLTCFENLNSLFIQDSDDRLFWGDLDRAVDRARFDRFEIYSRCPHLVDYGRVDKDLRNTFAWAHRAGTVWCVNRPSGRFPFISCAVLVPQAILIT